MTIYEFYSIDNAGHHEFFGILPERRKDPRRITKKSIMNWGRLAVCDPNYEKEIYFVTRSVFEPPPNSANVIELRSDEVRRMGFLSGR